MQGHNVPFHLVLALLILVGPNEANASKAFLVSNSNPPTPGSAEAKFVQQCAVQLFVRNKDMLPIDALNEYCETTDAIVECKLKLSMKLEKVHDRGKGMLSFCQAAYNWAQEKYGMLCPLQCEKFQCKSTCLWLEKRKKLTAEAKELQAKNLKSTVLEEKLDRAEFAADAAKHRFLNSNATVLRKQSDVKLARGLEKDRQELVESTEKRVMELQPKLFKLQSSVANLDSLSTTQATNIEDLQFQLDKMELKQKQLLRKEEELKGKILEGTAELENFTVKVTERQKELDTRLPKAQEMYGAQKKLTKIVREQQVVVQKWIIAYKRADFHVQNAIKEKAPKPAIDDLENLRQQQKERLQKETAVMNKAEQKLTYLQDEAKRYAKDTKFLAKWLKESKGAAAKKTSELAQLAADLESAQTTASSLAKGPMATLVAELSKDRAAASKTTEDFKQAKRTLALTRELEEQATARLKEEIAAAETLRKERSIAEGAFEKAVGEFQSSAKSFEAALKKANSLKKEYGKLYQDLLNDMEANRAAQRALKSWKPEIVGQHGLALQQSLLG